MSLRSRLREHWPEYLIEGWGLGSFMIAVGVFAMLLGSPASPLYTSVPSNILRTVLLGLALGAVIIALIHSPWGKRSGAHLNPAVTLAFLHLGKIHPNDALFYIIAQALGGTIGVVLVAIVAGNLFTEPPISYAATLPGGKGVAGAFVAETIISYVLMAAILVFSSSARLTRFTGIAVGFLVALFISIESPISGASMNPARTLASAAPGMRWQHFWIYILAPTLGMLAAARFHVFIRGTHKGCAKLLHSTGVPCIHCGLTPG